MLLHLLHFRGQRRDESGEEYLDGAEDAVDVDAEEGDGAPSGRKERSGLARQIEKTKKIARKHSLCLELRKLNFDSLASPVLFVCLYTSTAMASAHPPTSTPIPAIPPAVIIPEQRPQRRRTKKWWRRGARREKDGGREPSSDIRTWEYPKFSSAFICLSFREISPAICRILVCTCGAERPEPG